LVKFQKISNFCILVPIEVYKIVRGAIVGGIGVGCVMSRKTLGAQDVFCVIRKHMAYNKAGFSFWLCCIMRACGMG